MYIELFLLDNLLMNLLTLRLAAAMLSVRPGGKRILPFAALGSVAAALGAWGFPLLFSLPAKLLSAVLMAFALPAKGIRRRLLSVLALFLSASLTGGAVLLIALASGGGLSGGALRGGIPLRTALIGAAAAAFLPRLIIRILSRRVPKGGTVRLHMEFPCGAADCAALVDTGSTLTEPITGLPVIVLNRRKFASAAAYCDRTVPIRTAGGETVLPALRPKKLLLNGVPVSAVVAFSAAETALVPPALLPAGSSPEEISQVSSY